MAALFISVGGGLWTRYEKKCAT